MRFPGWKRFVSTILFLIMFVSSASFGLFLFYRTYEVASLSGRTTIMGLVTDERGRPLDEVAVTTEGHMNRTDGNGLFILDGVPEGALEISFFKPFFVPLVIRWVAYPLDELKGPLEGSINNISMNLDMVLWKEQRVERPSGHYSNGTLELQVLKDASHLSSVGSIEVSNGTGFIEHRLTNGTNILDVPGDGTFKIKAVPQGRVTGSFHPVGHTLNVTDLVMGLALNLTPDPRYEGGLSISVVNPDDADTVLVGIMGHSDGNVSLAKTIFIDEGGSQRWDLTLPTGVYSVSVTGMNIFDTYYSDLNVTKDGSTYINITLKDGPIDDNYRGLLVENNYQLAALNIILGSLFLLGAVLSFFGRSWVLLVVLAFLGFVSNGIVPTPIDLNHITSLTLLLLLMLIFKEERTKRRSRVGAGR